MEDKRNNKAQRPHTHQNPKRHISLMSLLLCHKIVAVRCFIWHLGLQMWSGCEAVRQNFEFLHFLKKFNIRRYFLALNTSFKVRLTSTIL